MTTYYLNGNPITEGSDINLNGMTYPYSWLEGTSPSVRASLGIEKIGDINYDPKYYWDINNPKILDDREESDENGNPIYVTVYDPTAANGQGAMVPTSTRAVQLGLKNLCLNEIKTITNSLLSSTDYLIIRNHVEETEIPALVTTYRAAVITESNRLQTAIPNVTTVEELITVMSSIAWPRAE
jgi:hypothetical protein